jgi:glutamate--cysteine ligase
MIESLAEKIVRNGPRLEEWYRNRLSQLATFDGAPPIYSSVDLRNSGYKIAVVDTNLFPAGFNNLCETFSEKGAGMFRDYFKKWRPSVKKILIFPEEHTRNLFYWKSVLALRNMLEEAGFEVKIGSASTLFDRDPFVIEIANGESVSIEKIFLKNGSLQCEGFVPDAILINNDLSSGIPEYLKGLHHQFLLPSPHHGWHQRKKSSHFAIYQTLVTEVACLLEIDPWLLAPLTTVETGIDLTDEICLKRLQESADRLLSRIRQKYLQHGVQKEPYLFIKNNSGTYGLGIIHVESGEKLLSLSRKLRNKLEFSKGGKEVSEYLLQEGIPTADFYRGKPLEPVVYLVGGEMIGSFCRIHEGKDERESLNAPGMTFACICLHKVTATKSWHLSYENSDQIFTVAALLGKVASLAAALELADPSASQMICENF